MPRVAYSMGYERRDMPDFIALLRAQGIKRVADVRNYPYSRKPGFSRPALEAELRKEGMEYRSFTELGAPKELREYAERAGMERFLEGYRKHLGSRKREFAQLVEYLGDDGGVILCLERDSRQCHRSVIEEALREEGYEIISVGDRPSKVWF